MKNCALFFVTVVNVFSFSCFAQQTDRSLIPNNQVAVVSYHVEERVNMNFGSSVTTYNVPSLNLVSNNNLGGNNTRVITPKYGKVRPKVVSIDLAKDAKPKELNSATAIIAEPVSTDKIGITSAKKDYVNIDVVGTYERVMDKGYKSVSMIIKVADRHFFDGDLVLAAKWYSELFSNNPTDLEAVYYYRYAESLKAVGQAAKANEMMKIFESKSL